MKEGNWFKNKLAVFKKQTQPPQEKGEMFGLNPDKMGPNDLALIVLNHLGVHVSAIEQIKYDHIKGTDLAGVASASGGGSSVRLEQFLNQTGVVPRHFLMIGDLTVTPNYEEVLKKTYQNIEKVVANDPFGSLGSLFNTIKSNSKSFGADTYILKNTKTEVAYLFPKKFAEGFFHLMKHLERLNYQGQLLDVFKEKNMPETIIKEQEEKLKKITADIHPASKYLQKWFQDQQEKKD